VVVTILGARGISLNSVDVRSRAVNKDTAVFFFDLIRNQRGVAVERASGIKGERMVHTVLNAGVISLNSVNIGSRAVDKDTSIGFFDLIRNQRGVAIKRASSVKGEGVVLAVLNTGSVSLLRVAVNMAVASN
jgi:hypothetical protein